MVVSEGTLHPHSPGFLIKGGAAWGDTFSDDGEFVAQTWEDAEDSQTPFPPPGLWKINPQTGATSREETEYVFSRVKAPGLVFGPNLEEEFVHFGPPAHNFGKNVFYCNLTKMSSGSLVVTCGPDVRRSRPRISKGGWQEIPTLSAIWDISSEGVAIVEHEVWNNGVTRAWKDVAPDLPQNLHPVTLRQISDRGHILGGEFQSSGSRVFAAFPIGLKDDAEGRGVDVTTAASKEEAWRGDHRLWAMVPKGSGVSNELEILSGATAVSPLKLSAPGVRFNGEEELTVTQSPFAVSLSAAGDAPDSGESLLEVKLGTAANEVISASKPIGFKFMKPRTVKVALIPVALEREVGGIYSPTLTPTADELRDKLHEIYRPQLNTTFAVTLMSELTVKWDLNNDRRLDVIDGAISAEQHAILNTPGANPDNFDIRIFVVGGPSPDEAGLFDMWGSFLASEELDGLDAFVVGWTLNVQADMNTCFVTGVQIKVNGVDRTKEKVILTSVHEVGHVFTGVGHPDNEEGIAPLLGTDRTRRVLASGYSERTDPGKLLVKTEWDKAEGWLIRVIDGNNQ